VIVAGRRACARRQGRPGPIIATVFVNIVGAMFAIWQRASHH
jgi:hypothetical protein